MLGDEFNYEEAMEVSEEKQRGLLRRCPACLFAWHDCTCHRWCAICACLTNHDTIAHKEIEEDGRAEHEG